MANDVNLGTYHDLFFKLGGCEKTADEFSELSEQKEIEAIKEKYAQWVAKYINVEDEKNPPEEGLPDAIEAENRYFAKREEEYAKETDPMARTDAYLKLESDYETAGWKGIRVGIAPAHSTPIAKIYHYNPNDPEYKGKSEDELRTMFTERLREEIEQNNQDKPKEDENKNGNNSLNIQEGQENTDAPTNQDENQDWKADKENFWKEHCGEREQECERDPEDQEGLSLNISKEGKKLGSVRYSDSKHASISGEDGKTADYSVFLGIVKDAKRNNQAINFSGEMSPEFAAKLKLACEEMGVAYQNAPEGKIDVHGFEDQLSEESKKKLNEYNTKQTYKDYKDQFKKDIAEGKEVDLSNIKDDKDQMIAYAAGLVAAKDAQKDGVEIKGAPEKTIGYKNEKVFELDENGVVKKGEDGKPQMTTNPLYESAQALPEEARAALEGHNQGVRQRQLETARGRVAGTPERAKEAARRQEFRDNDHKYDESSNSNTSADRQARTDYIRSQMAARNQGR